LQLAIVVCLVLLMLLGLFHTADAHSTASDADRCPLCIMMHSVAPFVVLAAAIVLIRIETPAPKLLEVRTIVRYWHPTLFTRPPPVGS
jgi:TRAP-type C4-dicarboxylate transport system permease small subunit